MTIFIHQSCKIIKMQTYQEVHLYQTLETIHLNSAFEDPWSWNLGLLRQSSMASTYNFLKAQVLVDSLMVKVG